MKRRFMKTLAAVLLLATLFCTAAYAAEWERQTGNLWVYRLDNGDVARDTWIAGEDGSEYYVGSNGTMLTDSWVAGNNVWYYVDANGRMVRGTMYQTGNGSTWYLFGNDGAMLTNTWYQDPETGDWYYFGADGAAYKDGWYNIDGYEYYFLKSSKMAHDALVPGGGVVGSDGRRIS